MLREASASAIGHLDILMHADNPFVLTAFEGDIQANRSDRAVLDRDHLVGRACPQARKSKQISLDDPAV